MYLYVYCMYYNQYNFYTYIICNTKLMTKKKTAKAVHMITLLLAALLESCFRYTRTGL